MKVLLLAPPQSSHVLKWANALVERDISVLLFGLNEPVFSEYNSKVKIETFKINNDVFKKAEGSFGKAVFLKSLSKIKKTIKLFDPDIVHSHYASSYGLLGALTGFHPYILSVWGADVFRFPRISFLHKKIFQFSLNRADNILSTSHIMANEIKKYTTKNILVTPFGVDVDVFKPGEGIAILEKEYDAVIGTTKGLEEIYGIDYLIRAFASVKNKLVNKKLKLVIVGDGSIRKEIEQLITELNLQKDVILTGKVKHSEINKYYNIIDIYVAISVNDAESFGVAILEASACEKPVIVSRIGGLPEVVAENVTGFIVQPKNVAETAEKIEKLIVDRNLRTQLGKAGRVRVVNEFNWEANVKKMVEIYKSNLI
jgi:L-malate glycosyltransferase